VGPLILSPATKIVTTTYSLTVDEEATAMRVGWERQLPMLAQPWRNRNYSEGDIWETWQHAVAAGAEIAFANMIGLQDFEPTVNTYKTERDVAGFEVRYTFRGESHHRLRLTDWDNPDYTYVLLSDGLRHRTRRTDDNQWRGEPYQLRGWATGHTIRQYGDRHERGWTLHHSMLNNLI
jgi:hypothetical protein